MTGRAPLTVARHDGRASLRHEAVRSADVAPVRVEGLTKRYGDVVAVDDLTFDVHPGMVTGFLGPNGSGKTTTFRLLLGLAAPTAGAALVFGCRYQDLADPMRRVGVLIDCSGFHPGRSARAHLAALAAAGGVDRARVDTLLELVGLGAAADRRVGGFSTGMRRRLGLAAALLGDPELLVLDEPANGLDPAGIRWLRDLLRGFAAEGRTVLVSSHVLAEISQVAHDVVVIRHGTLVAHGTLDDLRAASAAPVQARTPRPADLTAELVALGATVDHAESGQLIVTGLDRAQVGDAAAARGIALHELRQDSTSLEDAFLALTDEEAP